MIVGVSFVRVGVCYKQTTIVCAKQSGKEEMSLVAMDQWSLKGMWSEKGEMSSAVRD